jgi:hypothetical protein
MWYGYREEDWNLGCERTNRKWRDTEKDRVRLFKGPAFKDRVRLFKWPAFKDRVN